MENGNPNFKSLLAASQNTRERDYWLKKLSGELGRVAFPGDETGEGATGPGTGKAHWQYRFSPGLPAKLERLSAGTDVKLHIILVAALAVLVYRYTGETDILIGSPILRQPAGGRFINKTLVFRIQVAPGLSFKDLLLQVRQTIIEAHENQNYPMEVLGQQLNLPDTWWGGSLFDVALSLDNLHDRAYIPQNYYKTLFSFDRTAAGIDAFIGYETTLYREDTIRQLGGRLLVILDQVLDDLNLPVSGVSLLTGAEKENILADSSGPQIDDPLDKTLIALFLDQVERGPDAVALKAPAATEVGEGLVSGFSDRFTRHRTSLTYAGLAGQAERLALELREKGVQNNTLVALMLPPGLEMMTGILGILLAGGAYLPIDPDYPQERIDYILADSGAEVVIGSQTVGANCNSPLRETGVLYSAHRSTAPTDLAYVIYTSGSTGRPKGVLVEHRQVVAYLAAFSREFSLGPRDTVIQLASYAFDVFIEEVFPVLLAGGKVVIPFLAEMIDMALLCRLIGDEHVTFIDSTPLLLNEFNKVKGEPHPLRGVELVISGGDVLKREHIDRLLARGRVYNTYGPTETTVCATYYACTGGEKQVIPIGRPITNYRVFIMDERQELVPDGLKGEICIAGPGVTRGYLNHPELTAEKFVGADIPIGAGPTYRLYKTGDLGRRLGDGTIVFAGRIDNQVKIRGFRIELGEIENRLRRYTGIKDAVVTVRTDEGGENYLCAYLVGQGIDPARLREFLAQALPDFMIPAYFIEIDRVPVNRHGKLDQKTLPAPQLKAVQAFTPPSSRIERTLAAIYGEVLHRDVDQIGINDDFFALGGNSLKLIKLTTRIHEVFHVHLPMTQLFKNSAIQAIAPCIVENRFKASEEEDLVLLNQEKPRRLFCFPPAIAYSLVYLELAAALEDYALYGFHFIDDGPDMSRYVEAITRIQPQGPYCLFGYSSGGKLCLRLARELEKRGHCVSDIILMECYLDVEKFKSADFEDKAQEFFAAFQNGLLALGGEFLLEKAKTRVERYQAFFLNPEHLEPVRAHIHYLKAGDKQTLTGPLGWEGLTLGQYKTYTAFGPHEQMLSPQFVGQNAGVLAGILNQVFQDDDEQKI